MTGTTILEHPTRSWLVRTPGRDWTVRTHGETAETMFRRFLAEVSRCAREHRECRYEPVGRGRCVQFSAAVREMRFLVQYARPALRHGASR